jgi:NAD(P)-dependent dehydrogenase (short-subunit alcohol dehydrogenase family)
MRLQGKVAIITGSGSGFGQAAAVRFAEEGSRVVVVDLDAAGGGDTVKLIANAGSEAELVVADISTVEGAELAVAAARGRFGAVDVLVNNAGIVQGTANDAWNCEEAVWDRVLQVNLKSV